MKTLLFLSLLACYQTVQGLDNGLGLKPQMGWNSWNYFARTVNQTVIKQAADAIIAHGLDKLGYVYVNVDDCWAKSRGSDKRLQPDPATFPDFQDMIDYVHSKGLLFGLYSDAGFKTCQSRPGSLDYEEIDALTFAEWKVDYLKYDNCRNRGLPSIVRYPPMRDALNKTGRPIFYSICEGGQGDEPARWARDVGNSWRTTKDIKDTWDMMISRADLNNKWADYAGPGGWNDPDMLEVGNGGMSSTEYESHMSLWCLMKAPLLIGCNLNAMDKETLRILTNPEVIAINQDELGVQGRKLKTSLDGAAEVWGGPLSGGNFVVLLLNRGNSSARITARWTDFGLDLSRMAVVRDLWLQEDVGIVQGSVSAIVPSHAVKMYKITLLSFLASHYWSPLCFFNLFFILCIVVFLFWSRKTRTGMCRIVKV